MDDSGYGKSTGLYRNLISTPRTDESSITIAVHYFIGKLMTAGKWLAQ
jgi:hypothetical protein